MEKRDMLFSAIGFYDLGDDGEVSSPDPSLSVFSTPEPEHPIHKLFHPQLAKAAVADFSWDAPISATPIPGKRVSFEKGTIGHALGIVSVETVQYDGETWVQGSKTNQDAKDFFPGRPTGPGIRVE